MAENIPAQPDFARAARALRTAGKELAKCPNLPAIQEGEGIINVIRGMERRLSEQLRALSDQVLTLSTRQQASDYNNLARLENRMLHASDGDLKCLHNLRNNPIEGFPTTPAMIRQLRGAQLDGILLALGLDAIGTVEQKRTRLRLVVGLRTDVAY